MSPRELVEQLAEVIDGHRWEDLPALLHPEFSCHYVHTGETLTREAWVRLNADYPGFERFELLDCVADGDRAASRAHVTGVSEGERQHFEVAAFLTMRDGLIADLTEVWADVGTAPPAGTRPQQ